MANRAVMVPWAALARLVAEALLVVVAGGTVA